METTIKSNEKQAVRVRTALIADIHGAYGPQKGKSLIWYL